MGTTAENVAQAVADHAGTSRTSSRSPARTKPKPRKRPASFRDEIAPVTVKHRKGDISLRRGRIHPRRRDQSRGRCRSCARRSIKEGSVTAGNASGHQRRRGSPAADDRGRGGEATGHHAACADRRRGHTAGVDPSIMGTGPIPASQAGRSKRPAGRSRGSRSWWRPTRRSPPRPVPSTRASAGSPEKVNVNGGAIAIGHPIGASAVARILNDAACMKCSAATPRRGSPRCVSAAAWASPSRSRATRAPEVRFSLALVEGRLDRGGGQSGALQATRSPLPIVFPLPSLPFRAGDFAPDEMSKTTPARDPPGSSTTVRKRTHGTSGTGHGRHARYRRGHFQGDASMRVTRVAVSYAGNDEAAQKPSRPRRASPVYKWNGRGL